MKRREVRWQRDGKGECRGGWRKKQGEGGWKMRDWKVERGTTAWRTGRANVAEVKEKEVERTESRKDWKREERGVREGKGESKVK